MVHILLSWLLLWVSLLAIAAFWVCLMIAGFAVVYYGLAGCRFWFGLVFAVVWLALVVLRGGFVLLFVLRLSGV